MYYFLVGYVGVCPPDGVFFSRIGVITGLEFYYFGLELSIFSLIV